MIYLVIIVGLIGFFFFIRLIEISPDKAFWISVVLILDPGGYLNYYIGSRLPGYMMTTDLLVPLLFLPLFSSKVTLKEYLNDNKIRLLFYYLVLISIYLIIVYGLIVPGNNIETWGRFIYVRRYHIFSPLLIIPAYIFSKRSLSTYYKYTIKVAIIILTLYFLTLIIRIDFVPVAQMVRFKESGIIRYVLPGNGHMVFLILFSVIVMITNVRLPYQKSLIYTSSLMLLALILSLTRGPIISLVSQIIICIYMVGRIYKLPYVFAFLKYSLYLIILLTIMVFLLPKQMGWLNETFTMTYLELTGQVKEGTTQSRTLYEIPRQIALFKANPFFGAGYQRALHEGGLRGISIDATDTPFIASWAMYGIVGTLLFILLYIRILIDIIQHLKYLDDSSIDKITLIFYISISASFIGSLVFPISLFEEYIKPISLLNSCLVWGALYGTMGLIRQFIYDKQNAKEKI